RFVSRGNWLHIFMKMPSFLLSQLLGADGNDGNRAESCKSVLGARQVYCITLKKTHHLEFDSTFLQLSEKFWVGQLVAAYGYTVNRFNSKNVTIAELGIVGKVKLS
ncbi:hypothetical protein TYRP_023397, partial [Tyrophagus putrescentiae]